MNLQKTLISIISVTVILLSIWNCAEKPTEVSTLGGVEGIVYDASNNTALQGATVSIPDIGTRVTLSDGSYRFEEMVEEIYTISASKQNYVTETQTIEVVANKQKEVNFLLRVAQPAQLSVSPTSLNFGELETSLPLSVDNGGDEELSWTVSSDQSWLSIFPSTGLTSSESDQVSATVNRVGLSIGNYSASLSFTSNGGDINLPVQMTVPEVGLIVNVDSLDFGDTESELEFTISNAGSGELNWSLDIADDWVSATPTSGTITTSDQNVAVSVSRDGLDVGTYSGTIQISSNGGSHSINMLMVIPPAVISVTPDTLDFGEDQTDLSLQLSNAGSGELNWTAEASHNWLAVTPGGGAFSSSTSLSVSVSRGILDAGAYSGSINITSNGGNLSVPVFMDVSEFPAPNLNEPYNITENSLTLSWTSITHTDFSGYELYRSLSNTVDLNSTLVASINNSQQTTYSDEGLSGGTTYYYKVYSVNKYGVRAGSNITSGTTEVGVGSWGLVKSFDTSIDLYAIHAFSDQDVWVAGENAGKSVIFHFDGSGWLEITPPNIGRIDDLDFSSPSNGWAAGIIDGSDSEGGVLQYANGSWVSVTELDGIGPGGIDANSESDVWFTGRYGTYNYNGSTYEQIGIAGFAIEVFGNEGIVIGRDYQVMPIYWYNGFSWTEDAGWHKPNAGFRGRVKLAIAGEKIYFSCDADQQASVYVYEDNIWKSVITDGFGEGFPCIAAQTDEIVWFSGGMWDWLYRWDGVEYTRQDFNTLLDMMFFNSAVGWACGNNKVFRYN